MLAGHDAELAARIQLPLDLISPLHQKANGVLVEAQRLASETLVERGHLLESAGDVGQGLGCTIGFKDFVRTESELCHIPEPADVASIYRGHQVLDFLEGSHCVRGIATHGCKGLPQGLHLLCI
ncbi:MAG TPA: hypothetical protein DCP84_16600 [Pseudomonas sp.]|nr:hypothetical protein [Pseudomonas sp.]